MSKKWLIAFICLLFSAAFANEAPLAPQTASPAPSTFPGKKAPSTPSQANTKPKVVSIALYLLNLSRFELGAGAYVTDFYLSFKCDEGCELGHFEFVNGRAATTDLLLDTPTEKFYRVQANLSTNINLREFPFDEQELTIILEDKTRGADQLIFEPNLKESGVDPGIAFTGWAIKGWEAKAINHHYTVYNETFSQYVFGVKITRILFNSFLKTIFPIFCIVLTVLVTFFLSPESVAQRLAASGSALVAVVMFHLSISSQIPPVGYLTFADKFMILTYVILAAVFAVNTFLLQIDMKEEEDKKKAYRINHRAKWIFLIGTPLAYLALFLSRFI